jgi:hypothetical protein
MFSKQELEYLLICVDKAPITGLVDSRNKAHFLNRIPQLIEDLDKEASKEVEDDDSDS